MNLDFGFPVALIYSQGEIAYIIHSTGVKAFVDKVSGFPCILRPSSRLSFMQCIHIVMAAISYIFSFPPFPILFLRLCVSISSRFTGEENAFHVYGISM